MAWYNPLSWGEKATENILDKNDGLLAQVGGWIGNMDLTEEERIEFNAKTVASVQEFVKSTLSENTDRSKARRSIAKMWIKVELGLVLLCCIAAPWKPELARFYFEILSSGVMFGGTTAIIIFFFGSYGLARHNETKKE
jgi:hypothetical protein